MKKIFEKILLFINTVRRLKPVQIYGRIWFKFYKPKIKKGFFGLSLRKLSGKLITPLCAGAKWHFEKEIIFDGLNKKTHFSDDKIFWNDSKESLLTLYNRHYLDDIKDGGKGDWNHILNSWEKHNPIGSFPGWSSYPLSLRIVNLISYHSITKNLSENLISSIAAQTRWLNKKIEVHLQGNHLFANGKALVFAGIFFKGDEAEKWLKKGFSIINKEISNQVFKDGMHSEMSPMYHALFLIDILDLINLSYIADKIPYEYKTAWEKTAHKMIRALKILTHPDGRIALFGDSALNMIPETEKILNYARELKIYENDMLNEIEFLHDSGYIRIKNDKAVLIIKAGSLGADHLLGHAHADNTTFELSCVNERIIVDTGIDRYGESYERIRQRGTEAHNAVSVDDHNSSEVWAGFRMGKRAYPLNIEINKRNDGSIVCECGHTGYTRLKDGVLCRRIFRLYKDRLEIIDEFYAKKKHKYSWNIYTTKPLKVIVENKEAEIKPATVNEGFGINRKAFRFYADFFGSDKKIRAEIYFKKSYDDV